jgi:hypothetical protein
MTPVTVSIVAQAGLSNASYELMAGNAYTGNGG